MQSEPTGVREAVLKHMATPKDLWTIWSILAIFSGCALLLSIATTVTEVLAKSSHVLDWAAWTVAWSIWFFAAAYARRPEYYGAILQLRSAWHRKSRAERIRARCIGAGVAAAWLGLCFGAPILVGMMIWPGQSWGAYLLQAAPILKVEMAIPMAFVSLRGISRRWAHRIREPG